MLKLEKILGTIFVFCASMLFSFKGLSNIYRDSSTKPSENDPHKSYRELILSDQSLMLQIFVEKKYSIQFKKKNEFVEFVNFYDYMEFMMEREKNEEKYKVSGQPSCDGM